MGWTHICFMGELIFCVGLNQLLFCHVCLPLTFKPPRKPPEKNVKLRTSVKVVMNCVREPVWPQVAELSGSNVETPVNHGERNPWYLLECSCGEVWGLAAAGLNQPVRCLQPHGFSHTFYDNFHSCFFRLF